MSEENVKMVRRVLDLFETGDAMATLRAAMEIAHPEVEMDMMRLPAPGLARVYRGWDEIAGFWREWLGAWGSLGTVEGFEVADAGDEVVVWAKRQTMRGRGSGVEVDLPDYGWTLSVRDGKFIRATLFMERESALEAAGLSE